MPTYKYKAADNSGKNTKGIIDADTTTHAAKLLRESGLYPLKLTLLSTDSTSQPSAITKQSHPLRLPFSNRVPQSTIASYLRQLATLLNAGLELEESLQTVIEQGGASTMRSTLSQIRDRVREGSDLASALAEHPQIFDSTVITMIMAAESSGSLGIVMERLADHAEQQLALSRKIKSTLAYPIFMLVVGITVVIFLLTFVIPKVTQIFTDLDHALPTPTLILLTISTALQQYWIYLTSGLAILSLGIKKYVKTHHGKKLYHTCILHIPFLGSLHQQFAVARLCRTLGMLLNHGVSLVTGLHIVQNIAGNIILEQQIKEMNDGVQEGKSLAEFMHSSIFFPASAAQLVAAGEKSGQLSHMLLVVAADCDNQINTKLQLITSLIEPIMILLLGSIVGVVVMAIILPIFEMSSLVG